MVAVKAVTIGLYCLCAALPAQGQGQPQGTTGGSPSATSPAPMTTGQNSTSPAPEPMATEGSQQPHAPVMSAECMDAYHGYAMEAEAFQHGSEFLPNHGDVAMIREICTNGTALNISLSEVVEKCTHDDMIWDNETQSYTTVLHQAWMYQGLCNPCDSAIFAFHAYSMEDQATTFGSAEQCNETNGLNITLSQILQECPGSRTTEMFGDAVYLTQWCDPCMAVFRTGFDCTPMEVCDENSDCYSKVRQIDERCSDSHTHSDGHGNFRYVREEFSDFLDLLDSNVCEEGFSDCDMAVVDIEWPETCTSEEGPNIESACLPECRPLYQKVGDECSASDPPFPMRGNPAWPGIYTAIGDELAQCSEEMSCAQPVLLSREQFARLNAVPCGDF